MTSGTGKITVAGIFLTMLLTWGCRKDVIFTDTYPLHSETWKIDDIAEFSPEISDTATIDNIFFTIRTGSAYQFRNIWLFVNTVSPSGKRITDTLQYMLADEKGKPFGRGFGDVRELNLPFRTGVYFPEKGRYKFIIRHGMRTEDLRGIYDLGIRIEKARK
ncbi:MAG TPA: gliding motility lipoprotein GldH [Bacteroidales bacterium]|nr:gliding motility lipoprotein GldH [Bacteroidales bacterium]